MAHACHLGAGEVEAEGIPAILKYKFKPYIKKKQRRKWRRGKQ